MNEYIFVVIKDGTRTVSYEMPYDTPISEIFKKWRGGWLPFDEKSVKLNGNALLPEMFGIFVGTMADENRKVVIKVHTIFPKKGGDE